MAINFRTELSFDHRKAVLLDACRQWGQRGFAAYTLVVTELAANPSADVVADVAVVDAVVGAATTAQTVVAAAVVDADLPAWA